MSLAADAETVLHHQGRIAELAAERNKLLKGYGRDIQRHWDWTRAAHERIGQALHDAGYPDVALVGSALAVTFHSEQHGPRFYLIAADRFSLLPGVEVPALDLQPAEVA